MEKGDLVVGSNPDDNEAVYGIILWSRIIEGEHPVLTFMEILWQDGVISNEFSGELRLFL